MPTLKYLEDSFDCTTAIKGDDYIHLLDENGVLIAAFDKISDFSGFALLNGNYTSPTDDHDCYLAVIRDDGTIGRGGHKCSDVGTNDHTHKAGDVTSGTFPIARGGTGAATAAAALSNLGAAPKSHTHTADEVDALAKTGGEVTGPVTIKNTSPLLRLDNTTKTSRANISNLGHSVQLGMYNTSGSTDAYRALLLRDTDTTEDKTITGALVLADKIAGQSLKTYRVLHNGNISTNGVIRCTQGSRVGTGETSFTLTLTKDPDAQPLLLVHDGCISDPRLGVGFFRKETSDVLANTEWSTDENGNAVVTVSCSNSNHSAEHIGNLSGKTYYWTLFF